MAILKKSLVILLVLLTWSTLALKTSQETPITQQYRETIKNIKQIGEAITDYIAYHHTLPEAKTITELMNQDCGNGLTFAQFFLDQISEDQIPLKDAWGNDFIYQYQKQKFYIASPGSDGQFEGFGQTGVYINKPEHLDGKDIIFSNQGFILFPIEEHNFLRIISMLKLFLLGTAF